MIDNPQVICLTPTRNDGWVLDRFLKSASMWADVIIIADQMSTDGSRDIAKKYPKARLIDNNCDTYNELERKKLLIDAARKIEGDKILITLDVDEMFSPEIFVGDEFEKIKHLSKGTVIYFTWANFTNKAEKMWIGYSFPWGYVDDGYNDYDIGIPNNAIHCSRVPMSDDMPKYYVESFQVIHFQYTDWQRMVHKHYYYQCLEVLANPDKSAVDIYRQYHHMDAVSNKDLKNIPKMWIDWYNKNGIDILDVKKESVYWYDIEVLRLFEKYGTARFKLVSIWDAKWNNIKQLSGIESHKEVEIKDPRSAYVKLVHRWLKYTQNKIHKKNIRRIDRILKKIF